MRTPFANDMQKTIVQLLKAKNALDTFHRSRQFHLRLEQGENSAFMPLVIEKHGQGSKAEVTVTHYYEQNGDLCPDPDMAFIYLKSENETDPEKFFLVPCAYQDSFGYKRSRWTDEDGKEWINKKLNADQISFANQWGRNIRAQGWKNAKAVSFTHDAVTKLNSRSGDEIKPT
jgi:hypothetical protein